MCIRDRLIPNIGIEFYLEKKWSVSLNWMYAWWKSDRKHNYWRTYNDASSDHIVHKDLILRIEAVVRLIGRNNLVDDDTAFQTGM